MRIKLGVWLGVLGLICGGCGPLGTAPVPAAMHVQGNHIVDAYGQPISFRGVAADSLEYRCEGDGHFTDADFAAMHQWNINIVRVPLSAPFWLNANNVCPDYHQTVQTVVRRAENAGYSVVLSLFGIAPFPGRDPASGAGYPMPDAREAPVFWRSLAATFATDPHVLFEVYSEPHEWDNHDDFYVWTLWRDGGTVHNDSTIDGRVLGDYQSVGMQALVDIVNQVAPARIVLVNGMQWGGDLSYVTKGFALHGKNLGYSLHLYPGPRSQDPAGWPELFGNLAASTPVLATEFGQIDCGTDFVNLAMPYLTSHTTGMIAWVWDQGNCGRPGLLQNFSGTPTPYGQVIHDYFIKQP